MSRPARLALFLMVVAALSATALLVALRRGNLPGRRTHVSGAVPTGAPIPLTRVERRHARQELSARAANDEAAATTPGPPAAIELSARRFLAAFSRYELGDLTPHLARALRRSCTPRLARELLAAPPRPIAGQDPPRRARIPTLEVALTEAAGLEARVSGIARRGHASEPFSFLFRRTTWGWRAASVGE